MTYAPPPGPENPTPPPPQPQKSKAGLIVGIILGVLLLVCVGCGAAVWGFGWWADKKANEIIDQLPTGQALPPAQGQTGSHTVRYEISGSGEALITWARGTGGQDSETTQLPWSKEITVNDDNFGLIVSAFPRGKDAKVTGCRIVIDGEERRKGGAGTCSYTYVGKP